ncbi:hypothetical protein D3Y57_11535 [Sphingomonas paeninsulae]|jgi:hypothetical protein|uniref:DUF1330 domain-containing protein n=1 Tax=Sphingomonas paeninsulae TaxID=2319844 RepID=A0A494TGP8_SPHPE|nr:hypothetical protein [Sphingomonas paeninsulae]AYJ86482.1 hypothetical protein D3Y57_11535 [Sphingomonas paeninsulae]
MKIHALISFALATAAIAVTPAVAQRSNSEPGNYTSISMIKVLPGQFENYMDFLANQWKKQNEFAKKKGYLVSYHVLSAIDPRAGEPDLFLVMEFKDWPTTAESKRRQDEFVAMMKMDEHQMDAASAGRGPMRTQMGSMTLQEVLLK